MPVPSSYGNQTELNESRLWKFFLEICFALEEIHDKGIIHADLKPSNCLLQGKDMLIKLADFGVSKGKYMDVIKEFQIVPY